MVNFLEGDDEWRSHGNERADASNDGSFFANQPGGADSNRRFRGQSGAARARNDFQRPNQAVAADFADCGMGCKFVEFLLEIWAGVIANALDETEGFDGFQIGQSSCSAGRMGRVGITVGEIPC